MRGQNDSGKVAWMRSFYFLYLCVNKKKTNAATTLNAKTIERPAALGPAVAWAGICECHAVILPEDFRT